MKNEKELVRYTAARDLKGRPAFDLITSKTGEYVRYDQAAEMLAEKEQECSGYRDYAAEKSNQVAALQAELAQIKKQNIEKLADLISKKMIKSAEEISDTWANNFIYGNNDDDDSNSGLSSAISGKEQS